MRVSDDEQSLARHLTGQDKAFGQRGAGLCSTCTGAGDFSFLLRNLLSHHGFLSGTNGRVVEAGTRCSQGALR